MKIDLHYGHCSAMKLCHLVTLTTLSLIFGCEPSPTEAPRTLARPKSAASIITCNNFADCKSKILAANDGDTVHISAGTISWTEQLTVSKAVNIEGETISGGRDCTYTDKTILVDNMPRDRNRFFSYDLKNNPLVTSISGITFTGEGGAASNGSSPFITFGDSVGNSLVRLHHCHFTKLKSYGIYVYSGIGGVVDHCVTDDPPSQMMQNGVWNGDNPYGDKVFSQPAGYGANEFNNGFFSFESGCVDNTKNGSSNAAGGWDAKRGAKFVIRNYVFKGSVEILCHGTEEQRQHGGRAQDLYDNDYYFGDICMGLDGIRSGTLIAHDNRFHGCKPNGYGLSCYRTFSGQFGAPWGNADGLNGWDKNDPAGVFDSGTASGGSNTSLTDNSKNWAANKFVGYVARRDSDGKISLIVGNTNNTLNLYGYTYSATWANGQTYKIRRVLQPVDLPGYGPGDLLSGDNPSPRWLNQNTPEGCYSWNNKHDDGSKINFGPNAAAQPFQKAGVTYFNDTPLPGYSPPPFPHPLVSGATPSPSVVPTATASGTTPPPPTSTPIPSATAAGTPAAPTNLAAAPVSDTEIKLTWTDASNNETDFDVERSDVGINSGWKNIGTPPANTTIYNDTGLAANKQYWYKVRARNAVNYSWFSPEATATTSSGGQPTPTPAPTTPTSTPTATAAQSSTPTATAIPSATATATASASPVPTASGSPSASPQPTVIILLPGESVLIQAPKP